MDASIGPAGADELAGAAKRGLERTPQLARDGPDAAGLLGEAGELRAAVAEPYDEGAAV